MLLSSVIFYTLCGVISSVTTPSSLPPSIYFSQKAEKAVGTQPEKPFLVEKERATQGSVWKTHHPLKKSRQPQLVWKGKERKEEWKVEWKKGIVTPYPTRDKIELM